MPHDDGHPADFGFDADEWAPGPPDPEPPPAGEDPAIDPAAVHPFGITARGDISGWIGADPAPVPFVIGDFVEQGSVALLVGEGGAGKSYVALTAAISVAADLPFYGRAVIPGRAVCLFCEDSRGAIHARLSRLCQALDVPMEALVGRLFPVSLLDDPIADRTFWASRRPTARLRVLEDELSRIDDLRLLVIDCVTAVFDGEEIARRAVAAFLAALTAMARRLQIGVILIHHASKSGDGTALKMASGSTAWSFQSRAAAELRKATTDAPARFAVRKINNGVEWSVDLEWHDAVLMPAKTPDAFDRRFAGRRLDKIIFDRVNEAWEAGNPLSAQTQAKMRYLPTIVTQGGELKKMQAEVAMHPMDAARQLGRRPKKCKIAAWPESFSPF